jgi:hypothetical protein
VIRGVTATSGTLTGWRAARACWVPPRVSGNGILLGREGPQPQTGLGDYLGVRQPGIESVWLCRLGLSCHTATSPPPHYAGFLGGIAGGNIADSALWCYCAGWRKEGEHPSLRPSFLTWPCRFS